MNNKKILLCADAHVGVDLRFSCMAPGSVLQVSTSYFKEYTSISQLLKILMSQRTAKTYNKTCATKEDSNQPAHLRSLIKAIAYRM